MSLPATWTAAGLDETGRIPARTECPFVGRCDIAADEACHHRGTSHPVAFSCAMARLFCVVPVKPSAPPSKPPAAREVAVREDKR